MPERPEQQPPSGSVEALPSRALQPVSARAVAPWETPPAEDGAFNLIEYWRLFLKHRFLIGGVFLAVVIMVTAATLLMTPIYRAKTLLQIDRESVKVVEEDLMPTESMIAGQEFFETQHGVLRSRSLAQRVMESLALAETDAFVESMGASPEGRPGDRERKQQVIELLQDNLTVNGVSLSRLAEVSFDSPDPELAARVANAFAENYIQSNLDRRFESSAYAREFLETRLGEVKTRLEDSERKLVDYARTQQIIEYEETVNSAPRNLVTSNLAALNTALGSARAARVAAEERWRRAASVPVMSLPEVLQNMTVQQLMQTRARLAADYEQKLGVFKPEFPEMRQLKAQIDETDRQIAALAADIRSSIRDQYVIAANQEQSLQAQVNGLKGDFLEARDRKVEYDILKREADTNRTLYEGLLQRYKEISVAGGATTNNVSIVDRAEAPSDPVRPVLALNVAIGMVLGLGLGLLAALLREALDESLRVPEEVEMKLGAPVLGVVPLLGKDQDPAAALTDIRSAFAEAYYSLRTALQFSTADGTPKVLLVTSTRPGEGKSTTALAVAHGFARINKKVLLIDADLRNPSMHRTLEIDNSQGLSSVLAGSSKLDDVAVRVGPTLTMVPCGPLPPNPAELLSGGRLRELLAEARAQFDVVVIDGPPVLGLADAPLLAHYAAGVLFAVKSGQTKRGQARAALRRLAGANTRILGVVLTMFDTKAASYGYGYGYGYSYDYSYGLEDEPKKAANG